MSVDGAIKFFISYTCFVPNRWLPYTFTFIWSKRRNVVVSLPVCRIKYLLASLVPLFGITLEQQTLNSLYLFVLLILRGLIGIYTCCFGRFWSPSSESLVKRNSCNCNLCIILSNSMMSFVACLKALWKYCFVFLKEIV